MKVKYKKDKTIITLYTVEERHNIFNALRDYEKEQLRSKVNELLDEWMKEAKTLQL